MTAVRPIDHHSGVQTARDESRPFVGRARERALVRHLLRDAEAGRAAVVIVTGVPGAGKTALLRWASDTAGAAGAFLLRASGSEGGVPFDALRRLVAPLPELTVLLDGGVSGADPEEGAGRLGADVADALAAYARRRLLTVVVDDVHDLEPSTAAVLTAALATLDDSGARSGLRLLVLLASREPLAEGTVAARALHLDAARAVSLGGLDAQDVRDLLDAAGQRPSPPLVGELLESTGGLPLLVESAVERRARPGDAGDLAGEGVRVRTIAGEMRARFRDLDPAALDLLRLAAVLGEPWDAAALARVAGRDGAAVAAAMAAATDAHVVRPGRLGLRFAHPLVRAELLDGLGDDARRALHRTIADRLAPAAVEGVPDDEGTVRVADHLLRAWRPRRRAPGDAAPPEDVAVWCRRAAAVTQRWGAWHEAARYGAVAAGAASDPADAGRLYLDAGRAAYLAHDPERAEDLLARAIGHARSAGDAVTVVRAAMFLARRRAGSRYRIGARLELGELETAIAGAADAGGSIDLSAIIEAESAMVEALVVSGDSDRALALTSRARARAGADRDPAVERALGRLDFAEGIHHLRTLDLDDARACFTAGVRRSAPDDPQTATLHRSRLAVSLLMRGEVTDARHRAEAVEEDALAGGWVGEAGFAAAQLAVGHSLAGGSARQVTLDAVERAHRRWRATEFPYTMALLAPVVAAIGGRTAGGRQEIDGPAASVPRSSVSAALAAVEAGDADAALARFRRARWRHGFRGPVTQNSDAVAVALVEVGDILDEPSVVASAAGAVESLYDRGVLVTLGWPALVPRLGAVVCRHDGELGTARRLLDHAFLLCEREGLHAELPKVVLEQARQEAAGGAARADVAALLTDAVRAFDAEGMHGWIRRVDMVSQQLGLPPLVGVGTRDRTIFTNDVVSSTASNVQLGDALYLEQLRVHDRLVRSRLREFGGVEIKHTGDGLNAVFDDPADAARCALAAQDDVEHWRRSEPDLALRIRVGLAHGPAIPSEGDWFGLVQSEAARLCGRAEPGQVVVSAAVAAGLPPAGMAVDPLGPQLLKGLPAAIEAFLLRRV